MRHKIYLPLVLLIFGIVCPTVSAQYHVTATITGPEGDPEEYATYRIFAIPDTIHPVVGDVTTDMGVLDVALPKAGNYKLTVSAFMKLPVTVDFSVSADAPIADLGIIGTQFAGETLNELTVTAQRPLVTKEIDRIGYDVQADEDASTSTLREILRKVPLVTVEEDGSIKVNGSDNFQIYRNGRPNNAFTKNAKDIFAAIPASTIKKIEVITDPGAREDAESSGVILNIVTTSTTSMSGVTGNVGLNWASNQGPNANAFIMTQIKKLTLSGSGGFYKYFRNNTKGDVTSDTRYLETGNRNHNESQFKAGGQGGWFNVEGSFELDTLNLFTTSLNGFIGKNSHDLTSATTMFDAADNPLYSYSQYSFYPKNGYTDIDFSFDYQRSTRLKGETITLSYRLSHTRQDQDQKTNYFDMFNTPFAYTGIISDFDLKFFEHTFQADWARPLSKLFILNTGAKYILRTSHSNNHQTLTDVATTENEFEHRYNIFGVYGDLRGNFGKFSARAGVRYEYSRLEADFIKGGGEDYSSNLNDVVPNASIAWNASQYSMWKISYNRRIQRPGISYLNPAVSTSPNSVSYGNPDLKSMAMNTFVLNYSLIKAKFNLDLTATYAFTNNGTGSLQWSEDDISYSTYDNLLHSQVFNLSAFFQWQVGSKTSIMFNGNFGRANYSVDTETEHSSLGRWTGYGFMRVQQRLPWELTLSGSLHYFSGWCSSPYSYMYNPIQSMSYNVTLKRSFLKNKSLDVSISASDIGMPKRRTITRTLNNGTIGRSETVMHNRMGVTVGISWRFGSLRAQVKKAANTISNDDLQGRKNE